MGIVDEVLDEVGYKPASKKEEEKFRPSTYNPLRAYPEHLWDELRGAGREMYRGGEEIGQGRYLRGAADIGLGALRGAWSPTEAGIRTAAYPLAEATGVPEEYLDIGANLALLGPGMYRGARGLARKFMGVGGEAAEEAAPVSKVAEEAEPRIGATNREEWLRDYEARKQAYQQRTGGARMARMEEAAGRTPAVSPAERFFPETPVEETRAAPGEYGYGKKPWVSPSKGLAEEEMFGGRRMFPEQQLPPPAIRLSDQTRRWAKPGPAEEAYLMGGLPKWQKPAGRLAEEEMFGGRRMMPEQQIPDYTLGTFAGRAVEQSGAMRGRVKEALAAPPETRPIKQVKPKAEETPPSLPKEEKLKTLEAEGTRSLYDAIRTLEASGMASEEAEKHIIDSIRAGLMTAVKTSGAPLTKSEAKKLRSLKGLGGVTWLRG